MIELQLNYKLNPGSTGLFFLPGLQWRMENHTRGLRHADGQYEKRNYFIYL